MYTLQDAIQYGNNDKIEEWVHAFLLGDGNNKPFSDGLKLQKRYFTNPIPFKLNRLSRCCGPENGMKFQINKEGFEDRVNAMIEALKKGWDMPPFIVYYEKGVFELNDGNHRFEALLRQGRTHHHVILWTTDIENFEELSAI